MAMAGATCMLTHKCLHPQFLERPSYVQAPAKQRRLRWRTRASTELAEATQVVGSPDLSWQIAAGAIAGVTPFVVAGIEFSKRIAAQRRCKVCQGSGLVEKWGYYFRCNGCGGFLPWQSWRRFFSGR